jgi:hypothetical protein
MERMDHTVPKPQATALAERSFWLRDNTLLSYMDGDVLTWDIITVHPTPNPSAADGMTQPAVSITLTPAPAFGGEHLEYTLVLSHHDAAQLVAAIAAATIQPQAVHA